MKYTPYTVNCLFLVLILFTSGCGRDGLTRLIPCTESTDCGRGLCVEGFCDSGDEGLTSSPDEDAGHSGDLTEEDGTPSGDLTEEDGTPSGDMTEEDGGLSGDLAVEDIVETFDRGRAEMGVIDAPVNQDIVSREDIILVDDLQGEDLFDGGTGTDTSEGNACGGTEALDAEPGTFCEADCGDGVWDCATPNSVECIGERPENACGGCGPLDGSPGDACTCEGEGWGDDEDGFLECDGTNSLECECEDVIDPVEPDGTCDAPFTFLPSLDDDDVGEATVEHDLCDADDNLDIGDTDDCGDIGLPGNDLVYQFTLSEERDIYIELIDDDSGSAIDTVVSIRTECEDEDSQLICADDMLCTDENEDLGTCVGDYQPRQSIIDTVLEAGTYYLVIDSYEYDSEDFGLDGPTWVCGDISMIFSQW
jgi:hypothetical protein